MNMKQIGAMGAFIMLILVVFASGCTSEPSSSNNTTGSSVSGSEKLIGSYKISQATDSAIGGKKLLVLLPDGTSAVRVVYTLNGGETGANGNLGVNPNVISSGTGEDPSMSSTESKYLEAGQGATIKGEIKFSGGKTFWYIGNFASGSFDVYATT